MCSSQSFKLMSPFPTSLANTIWVEDVNSSQSHSWCEQRTHIAFLHPKWTHPFTSVIAATSTATPANRSDAHRNAKVADALATWTTSMIRVLLLRRTHHDTHTMMWNCDSHKSLVLWALRVLYETRFCRP